MVIIAHVRIIAFMRQVRKVFYDKHTDKKKKKRIENVR